MLGNGDKKTASQVPKSTSEPAMLTVGKTRSQSRRLIAGNEQHVPHATKERSSSAMPEARPERARHSSLRPSSKVEMREPPRRVEKDKENIKKEDDVKQQLAPGARGHGLGRSNSKKESSGSKERSNFGQNALFHPEDQCEVLPGTSVNDVNTDLRHMLASLVPHPPWTSAGRIEEVATRICYQVG